MRYWADIAFWALLVGLMIVVYVRSTAHLTVVPL